MNENIIEFELAEDVKEFIKENPDVDYANTSIKPKIIDADNSDLLKTVKTITSPTTFLSVDVVDDAFIEKEI